jgi:hypothetical protein
MIRPWTEPLIAFLNEVARIDPQALRALIEQRVPCGDALADHPSVQVDASTSPAHVGLLGILNGFCGVIEAGEREGWGPITAEIGPDALTFRRTVPDEKLPMEGLEQTLDVIRQQLAPWFEKGRRVTAVAYRDPIPLEPQPGDMGRRFAKGDLTIVIQAKMP